MSTYINKTEAARRLINAAVRLRFMNADKLAIYVVIHAAFRCLCDILEKRGISLYEDNLAYSVFSLAIALENKWKLSETEKLLLDQQPIKEVVDIIIEQRAHGNVQTHRDFQVFVPDELKMKFFHSLSVPANFLKHADKDWNKFIPEAEFDPDQLIVAACAAYRDVMKNLSFEMKLFGLFKEVITIGRLREMRSPWHKLAKSLAKLSEEKRASMCLTLLEERDTRKRDRIWTPPTTLSWARERRLDRRLGGCRACGGAA